MKMQAIKVFQAEVPNGSGGVVMRKEFLAGFPELIQTIIPRLLCGRSRHPEGDLWELGLQIPQIQDALRRHDLCRWIRDHARDFIPQRGFEEADWGGYEQCAKALAEILAMTRWRTPGWSAAKLLREYNGKGFRGLVLGLRSFLAYSTFPPILCQVLFERKRNASMRWPTEDFISEYFALFEEHCELDEALECIGHFFRNQNLPNGVRMLAMERLLPSLKTSRTVRRWFIEVRDQKPANAYVELRKRVRHELKAASHVQA